MHPLLRSPKLFAITLLFWLPVAGGIIALQKIISGSAWTPLVAIMAPPLFILLFILLSTWYLCKSIELNRSNFLYLIGQHLLAAISVIIIWLFIAMVYSEMLVIVSGVLEWRQIFNNALPLLSIISLLFYFISIFFNYLALAIEKMQTIERRALESKLAATAAELRALQATVHPHFLFNSLTALTSLIKIAPEKAEASCKKLSDFLRYSLKYTQYDYVPMREEISGIQDYLSIERIRLGERLKTNMQIDPAIQDERIPPLILLPLIENGIKHGVSRQILGGELLLTVKDAGDMLNIMIKNPREENNIADYGEGLGLSTLRKKLKSVYGSNFTLKIDNNTSSFIVHLSIPKLKLDE